MNRLVLIGLLALLSGCASRVTTGIYVLSPPIDAQASAGVRLAGLHLQPVSLPDYLDTTEILLRVGPNRLAASETGRWGERLSRGVTGALAAALVRRLPGLAVTTGTASETTALQWQVDIESFDVQPDGHCLLAARWALLSGDGRATRSSGRGVFEVAASGRAGDPAIAAAMGEAIGQLADRLAAATEQEQRR